jgi:hypothetical protein
MRPLHYLLIHSELSPAKLAEHLLTLARPLGTTRRELEGADLHRMAMDKMRVPAWLRQISLEEALRTGWKPESAEDLRITVRTWRRLNPDKTMEDYCTAVSVRLSDVPDLPRIWTTDAARHAETEA